MLIPLGLLAQKSKPWNKPLYDAYKFHYGFAFTAGKLDFSYAPHINLYAPVDKDHPRPLDSIYSIEGKGGFLFGASIVGNMRINENWDLRLLPGLYFGQRQLDYLMNKEGSKDIILHDMVIESTFLQFPLLLKYRAERQNNYRPYVVFGVNYALDLASRKKIKEQEKPKIRLDRHDVLLEAGFGVDYYLPYFKFSSEIRFSYGILNIVNYDDTRYTQAIKKLGTKMVTLVIYFE
ncbi:MAG: porin family protein [Salinivirgaceae bacterium]|nr:porin family protein [Salinivirgaceae bacterium]